MEPFDVWPWMTAAALLLGVAATVAWLRRRREAKVGSTGRATAGDVADVDSPANREDGPLDGATAADDYRLGVDAALPDVLIDPEVLVEKSRRTLAVLSGGVPVKRYRIALGAEPVGDKERAGDRRTPVGDYYVCTRNAESRHHRSLGLSYPNADDAERGLAAGLITKREHRAILDAMRHMTRPPWKTPLGGEIMIHGGGVEEDWTEGCIALDDDAAEELFHALPLGTPVHIVP